MNEIKIEGEYIKLGQLLKVSGICSSGTEAKYIINEGKVLLNGEIEKQRGRKLIKNDIIKVNEETIKIL